MMIDNLDLLRIAADSIRNKFPESVWTKIAGPGPDELRMLGGGSFNALDLSQAQPHQELILTCALDLPPQLFGVDITGEPLEATLDSIHVVNISYEGNSVFSEPSTPVAAGPALFTIIPSLKAGVNGTIEIRFRTASYFMVNSFILKLTTPSLRKRFEQLDVAWAQLVLANAMAVSQAERDTVAAAAALVPQLLETPVATSEHYFKRFAETLAPLSAKVAAISVELIGHCHIDLNWLWPWADTFEVIRRDFKSVLAIMDDYPELTFSHSQPAAYEVIRQTAPDLFAKLLKQIKAGRWEATTMQWVEPDSNMPAGEAHARQLLEGVHYTRDVLGVIPTVFHSPDTFGHAGNIPQLAASAGAGCYYHHRGNPGQAEQWPAYWWEGQDGTRLLTFSTPAYNSEITAGELARAALRAYHAGHAVAAHFHGVGDHGGGPARQQLDSLRRLQKIPGLPSAACGTMAGYARKILESGVKLPVHRGETSTIFEGCYTTHADTKRYNRSGENLLIAAETLHALTHNTPNVQLDEAWRTVLFNQFHDIIDGSAIHEVYDGNAKDFEAVQATANTSISNSLDILERGIAGGRIAVTNQLAFERADLVTLKDHHGKGSVLLVGDHGHTTPGQYCTDGLKFVARVPALTTVSYAISTLSKDSKFEDIEALPTFAATDPRSTSPQVELVDKPYYKVETPIFIAYVRRDCGIIVSLFDKRCSRELVSFGMRRASDYSDSARADLGLGVLQIFDELPHGMSSWQMNEVHNERSLLNGSTADVVETGPVLCVLETKHAVRASTIIQRITFYRDLSRIDFQTTVDWKEIGNPTAGVPGLKVAFTAHLNECNAWYETPFAAATRPADGMEVPALRWADVGGKEYGIAILNDSKYGHDAMGCRLRLTLLRSGYEPDLVSDAGLHQVRYSLFPHSGDWRDAGVVREGISFNQPLFSRSARQQSSERAEHCCRPTISSTGSVELSTFKISRDGRSLILRLYESAGRTAIARITGIPTSAAVYEVTILEDRLRCLLNNGDGIAISFAHWRVRTLLVEFKGQNNSNVIS